MRRITAQETGRSALSALAEPRRRTAAGLLHYMGFPAEGTGQIAFSTVDLRPCISGGLYHEAGWSIDLEATISAGLR